MDVKVVSFYDVKPEELKEAEAIAVGSSTFYYKMLLPMEKFMNETLVSINPQQAGSCFRVLRVERGSAHNDSRKDEGTGG